MGILANMYFFSASTMQRKQIALLEELTKFIENLRTSYTDSNNLYPSPATEKKITLLADTSEMVEKTKATILDGKKAVIERQMWKALKKIHKQCLLEIKRNQSTVKKNKYAATADHLYFKFDRQT